MKELRKQCSTRRYTYEGHGALKHDKTLILHKSENCKNDTILLRLCKRFSGRIAYSSCFRTKVFLATIFALTAIFCYFNLFSSYLPRTCQVLNIRSYRKVKSTENETVLLRTLNALSESKLGLTPPLHKDDQIVSTFTKQVAKDLWQNSFSSSILHRLQSTPLGPNTVLKKYDSATITVTSPAIKFRVNPLEYVETNFKEEVSLVKKREPLQKKNTFGEVYEYYEDNSLISRIVKTGRLVNID